MGKAVLSSTSDRYFLQHSHHSDKHRQSFPVENMVRHALLQTRFLHSCSIHPHFALFQCPSLRLLALSGSNCKTHCQRVDPLATWSKSRRLAYISDHRGDNLEDGNKTVWRTCRWSHCMIPNLVLIFLENGRLVHHKGHVCRTVE